MIQGLQGTTCHFNTEAKPEYKITSSQRLTLGSDQTRKLPEYELEREGEGKNNPENIFLYWSWVKDIAKVDCSSIQIAEDEEGGFDLSKNNSPPTFTEWKSSTQPTLMLLLIH